MFFDDVVFAQHLSLWQVIYRLLVAVAISAVIGIDREMKSRPAGMRTHVLVCIGAALVALAEQQTIAYVAALGSSQINVSVGRITSAIVSGVGFLGAGTIVMSEHRIMGLTTAASLWCTACLGLAIGMGYETMALVAGILIFIVLKLMQRVVHVHTYKKLEVQFFHRKETLAFLQQYFEKMNVKVLDVDFHAETRPTGETLYTNLYTLSIPNRTNYTEIMATLSEQANIRTVRTRNV